MDKSAPDTKESPGPIVHREYQNSYRGQNNPSAERQNYNVNDMMRNIGVAGHKRGDGRSTVDPLDTEMAQKTFNHINSVYKMRNDITKNHL